MVNAVSLWNTRYIGLALETPAAEGLEVRVEDVERLSPLRHEHVNPLGRYQFSLADDLLQSGLRPLRRLDILEED